MTIEQEAAQILADGFVPIDGVPVDFADFVKDRIAARPSPTPTTSDPLAEIRDRLDEILNLLRGGTPE